MPDCKEAKAFEIMFMAPTNILNKMTFINEILRKQEIFCLG